METVVKVGDIVTIKPERAIYNLNVTRDAKVIKIYDKTLYNMYLCEIKKSKCKVCVTDQDILCVKNVKVKKTRREWNENNRIKKV